MIDSSYEKPNNVWVFFTVEKGDEPVAGLEAKDFEIYEDGALVSEFESKQTIQNPEVAAVMYTLLLLDVSGSITEAGEADKLVDAAKQFTEQVGKTQKVAVYAFDGEEKLHPVVPFTETQGRAEGGLETLRTYKPKDPSTNLHGAVILGIRELKLALDKDQKPLKFGTLVVFSDGSDRAARYSREEMNNELNKEDYGNYEMFAIGVGAEIAKAKLDDIGRDGTELASDDASVKTAFETIAKRIEAHTKRFYLLSYCTPARKGEHEVEIVAKSEKDPKGKGSLTDNFDAAGFGPPPECDPNRLPKFSLDPGKNAKAKKISGKSGSSGSKGSGKVKAKAEADVVVD
ncbi:MAG: VWA domain-containing protein [Nannocystaceae bacterium]